MNVVKRDDRFSEEFEASAAPIPGIASSAIQVQTADETTDFKAQLAFYLTGHRVGDSLRGIDERRAQPALLARYRDLAGLRYDFPLVLVAGTPGPGGVRSLTDIVDDLLRGVAPRGPEGEKIRRCMLRVEQEIRRRVANGARGSLSTIWDQVASELASQDGEPLRDVLRPVRAALKQDGEVADCDAGLPERLLVHAWKTTQRQKARRLREEIRRLVVKLSDILEADFARSAEGQRSDHLRASLGPAHETTFDFDALSRVLGRNAAKHTLSDSRRRRIEGVLSALQAQRFVQPDREDTSPGGDRVHEFVFDSCGAALAAFRSRLPELIGLVKAIAIAELEIEGGYVEPGHDLLFAQFDEEALSPRDLRIFPDYLVCLRAAEMADTENAGLVDALASGLPIKILVQTDDLLPPLGDGDVRFSMNLRSMRLASMALGLGDAFVMQSSASNLYQSREQLLRGITRDGPALFSVYSGAAGAMSGLPPYLAAAAAMQSRAFPAFTYDPSAGSHWGERFTIAGNPQAERDWPVERFVYEDQTHQRVEEDLAFTFVDFVACDSRYAAHFAEVPRADWHDTMVPVARCLADDPPMMADDVPYVALVDEENRLARAVVHEKLMRAADRCEDMWRSLRELGAARGSHADGAAEVAPGSRPAPAQDDGKGATAGGQPAGAEATAAAAAAPVSPAPVAAAAASPAAEAPEESSDEAYIETPRCTTCNECTTINGKMFAYDENKQAYIADIDAGSYRELVEAAESCQVSIIHPGKPRNAKEPGLDELLERAAPFL
jgi:ferredoxin